jgi:hypothetical protein
MNIIAVRKMLRAECDRISLAAFAERAGVSSTHAHNVIVGKRKPRGRILAALGLEVVEDYRHKRPRA